MNFIVKLDFLCSLLAQYQMPYHPGLTRGLVAILLYYDGQKALVTSLKILVQARLGILWTLESSDQVAEYITNYTSDLLEHEIVNKILSKCISIFCDNILIVLCKKYVLMYNRN